MTADRAPGSYDGRVTAGGPAQTRPLGSLEIHKVQVGGMGNNAYLIVDTASRDAVLVDAAADWPTLARLIGDAGAIVRTIVTTHRHVDHTGALRDAADATGAQVAAGEADADHLPVTADIRLQDGDTIALGEHTIAVIHLQGHTPGSIALAVRDDAGRTHLFTGDSLFPGGVGATNHYDYQSFPQLYADVTTKLFGRFDDSSWVYPGHGDDTTIGTERPHLAEWKERGW